MWKEWQELGNHSFAINIVMNDSCKSHQWMLRPLNQRILGNSLFPSFQCTPHRLWTTKGKMSFHSGEIWKCPLTRWWRSIINHGTRWVHVCPEVMHWGHTNHVVSLPKTLNTHGIIKKPSDKPKLKDILQNGWPILFKNVNVIENKGHVFTAALFTRARRWKTPRWAHPTLCRPWEADGCWQL